MRMTCIFSLEGYGVKAVQLLHYLITSMIHALSCNRSQKGFNNELHLIIVV